jgi:CBS domain-containing protein
MQRPNVERRSIVTCSPKTIDDGLCATSIDQFALRPTPVSSDTPCSDVYDRFAADDSLIALPVVDGERPVGLVCRWEFEHTLAQSYGRALYERKPISVLMDREPLIVENGTPVETIQGIIAADRPSALLRGFIVTEKNTYVGLGTALGLLKASLAEAEKRNRKLPLAKRLTEQHGGTLHLTSAPGVGTTVTVSFPCERVIDEDCGAEKPGAAAAI